VLHLDLGVSLRRAPGLDSMLRVVRNTKVAPYAAYVERCITGGRCSTVRWNTSWYHSLPIADTVNSCTAASVVGYLPLRPPDGR
jgi:hypothetical protein